MTGAAQGFLWRITCKVPECGVGVFEDYLRRHCGVVSAIIGVNDAEWVLEGLSDVEPDREAVERGAVVIAGDMDSKVPAFNYDLCPPIDWVAENLSSFPPVRWGRYFVHGTHYDKGIPKGCVPLKLNAGTAFGSGEHPTTGGCLSALDRLARKHKFRRALDVGCGSGILGIAMAKTWGVPVLACDIDPEAVHVTRENARLNRTGGLLRSLVADGYKNRQITRNAPYDLVTSNILARPLARMADGLGDVLASGGVVVLSGVVERDAQWMISTHRRADLVLMERTVIDGWSALVFRRC